MILSDSAPTAIKMFRLVALIPVTLLLTSCYVPMTFPETASDELHSNFAKVTLLVDPGAIEVSLSDENRDLRSLQFGSAEFVSPEGKRLPVCLPTQKYKFDPPSGTSLHSAYFKLAFEDQHYYPRGQFQLTLVARLGSQILTFSGKFSEHHRTEMINLYDALDHG